MSGEFKTVLGMEAVDTVTGDFTAAIDTMLGENIGRRGRLGDYDWAPGGDGEDQDGTWPFVVMRDGREFEVDIDVRVVELTRGES